MTSYSSILESSVFTNFSNIYTPWFAVLVYSKGHLTDYHRHTHKCSFTGRENLARLAAEKEGLQQELQGLNAATVDRNSSYEAELAEQACSFEAP